MAAGQSALESKYGGRHGCNLTTFGGQVNGNMGGRAGWGKATSLLSNTTFGVVVMDDEDYAVEELQQQYEDETKTSDPQPVPKDRKRDRESERQAFRQERKKMKKDVEKDAVVKADEKPEKKLELNPLLRVKNKDGAVSSDGISGGEATATAKSPPDIDTLARDIENCAADQAEEPPSAPSRASGTSLASSSHCVGALSDTTTAPPPIGSLLGGYDSDDDSSDVEDSGNLSNYNYLNLSTQVKSPVPATATATESPRKLPLPRTPFQSMETATNTSAQQRKFPLPVNRPETLTQSSGVAAMVTAPSPAAAAIDITAEVTPQRRFPLPKFRSQVASAAALEEFLQPRAAPEERKAPAGMGTSLQMKEVSPALAALMSGLDC